MSMDLYYPFQNQAMPTSLFIKDLYMLQETANSNLEIGSNLVRKREISHWFMHYEIDSDWTIDWNAITSTLQSWESNGYIKILADPRLCKEKDSCFQVLRPITAIPLPTDLVDP